MGDKEILIHWLIEEGLMEKNVCVLCATERWAWQVARIDPICSNGNVEGKKRAKDTRQRFRSGKEAGLKKAKWHLEEILKLTYWWCQDLDQAQIKHELGLAESTFVDWDSFCREVCEITLLENSERLGGEGKIVQIDESKFGKRKYHRGHHVEGQWVFGGMEQDSRKCFLVAVKRRDEETLLPIIQKLIAPGTIIVSDSWKAYCNLEKHGDKRKWWQHEQNRRSLETSEM